MDDQISQRKRPLQSALIWFAAVPIGIGLLCGFGMHFYQAAQIREDFAPYRVVDATSSYKAPPQRAFGYIAKPLDVEFGEVENFKRYRTEWEIVSTGQETLQIELVSHSCEVDFDGRPMQDIETLPSRTLATIALTWVVANSEKEFQQELVLKTNDNVSSRRELKFQVHGTVNPAIELLPPDLDFGLLTGGQTKELTTRVVCYRTKNFKIDDFTYSSESLRAGFDVKIEAIEDLRSLNLAPMPASAFEVKITAKPDQLERKSQTGSLRLQSNLPQTEGLAIGLKVAVQ